MSEGAGVVSERNTFVCQRCGERLPLSEHVGDLTCQSCTEDAWERYVSDYYGADVPMTMAERAREEGL